MGQNEKAENKDEDVELNEAEQAEKSTAETSEANAAAAAEAASDDEETVDDEIDAVEDELDSLKGELDHSKDMAIRLRAEMENLRKRSAKEVLQAREDGKHNALDEILVVMDQFQMAMQAIESSDDIEVLKQGMGMIFNTFNQAFANLGVERISTVGEQFDPNLHEAISTEASDEVPEDHVITEWKAGYRSGERLLRAASVVISSGPQEAAEDKDADADEKTETETDETETQD